jgi:hypothetical protein
MSLFALMVHADDTVVIPNTGGLSSGQLWTIFTFGLLGVAYLLYRSLTKQLGRINIPKSGEQQ